MQCIVKKWVSMIWLKVTTKIMQLKCERLVFYNLNKRGQDITNDVNVVHSETMGVYNLAKKRTTLLTILMQCTLHNKKQGVHNLARKIITFSMHEKINYL